MTCTLTLPSTQIRVVDSGAVDGSDLSFLEAGAKGGRSRRGLETGFNNTLLTSGVHTNHLKDDEEGDGQANPVDAEIVSQEL